MIRLSLLECRDPIGSRHSPCSPIPLAPLLPSIISGGAGIISSLIGAIGANKNTRSTNATNLQIARDTNQMSLDAMREQNQFNRSMALEMFNRENEYNDPSNQARLWLNAGFSPQVALGNNAMAQSEGNISTPQASGLPNFVTPTMQTPPSVMLSAVDSISKLAGASAQLAQAKKTNKEVSWIDKEMDAQIQEIFSRIKNQEAETAYTNVLKSLEEAYGDKERASKIANTYAECYLNYLKGDTEQGNALWKKFEAQISEEKAGREKQLTPYILAEAEESVNLLKEKQKTEKSQQSFNYSGVGVNNAREADIREDTAFKKDVHEANVNIRKNENELSNYEVYKTKRTIEQQVEYILNQTWCSDTQKQILQEQLKKAQMENDWYDWQQTQQSIGFILNTVEGAAVPWMPVNSVSYGSKGYYRQTTTGR